MKFMTDQIIGASPAFLDMTDQISRAAPLGRPMLVIGERGTGKEMIAARLHYLSNRWNFSYQKMNCAALAETLLESELFGYEPGAFTGARNKKAGRFEAANKGTLFLDEIGTMSMAAQEKLLRVIEYGEFERVGGTDTITVDVRVVAATNIDLPSAAKRGKFRHDLLDRLAFDVITVPPLRERTEDIPLLANHFGATMASELEWLQFPGFTEEAMEAMLQYKWPGNVRELKNVVERAIYQAWDGEEPVSNIVFDPFESPYRPKAENYHPENYKSEDIDTIKTASEEKVHTHTLPTEPYDLRSYIAEQEKTFVEDALEKCRYHQGETAKFLGLNYDQLRHMLRKHAINVSITASSPRQ